MDEEIAHQVRKDHAAYPVSCKKQARVEIGIFWKPLVVVHTAEGEDIRFSSTSSSSSNARMGFPKSGKRQKRLLLPPPPPPPPPPRFSKYAHWFPAASAVGVAIVLALLAKVFAPPIHYLSTYNRTQMQEVFLGKETWAILCSDSTSEGDKGEKSGKDAVMKRFGNAARELRGVVKFGVVDCTGSLPSGKSILQKFELSEDTKPVVFVTGGGMNPVQATAGHMQTAGSLHKWIQATARPGATPVTSTRELESKCLKKEQCALIIKAAPLEERVKDAFKELMARHRNLRFVSLDATKHETSIEKKMDIKPFDGAHQLLHITRYNVTSKPKVGTPRWGVQAYEGALETEFMSTFLEDAARVGQDGSLKDLKKITNLTRLPTVMARKKQKPKPSQAPAPVHGGDTEVGAGAETREGGAARGEPDAGDASETGNNYGGMNKDQLLEEFRRKQAERESARRKAMDEEADNLFFETDEGAIEGGPDEEVAWSVEGEGEGDGGYAGGGWDWEEEGEEEDEEMVDLDAM